MVEVEHHGSISNNLQYVNLKTVTAKYCQDQMNPIKIFDTDICTYTKTKGSASMEIPVVHSLMQMVN